MVSVGIPESGLVHDSFVGLRWPFPSLEHLQIPGFARERNTAVCLVGGNVPGLTCDVRRIRDRLGIRLLKVKENVMERDVPDVRRGRWAFRKWCSGGIPE